MFKPYVNLASSSSTVVEHLTLIPKLKGSNTAIGTRRERTGFQQKIKKSFNFKLRSSNYGKDLSGKTRGQCNKTFLSVIYVFSY